MSNAKPYLDKYPHIFSPMEVGVNKDVYKNRLFVAPMRSPAFFDGLQLLNDYGIEFFASKAQGGFACVTLGEAKTDNLNSVAHGTHVDITTERQLPQLHRLNEWAHAFGAKTGIEFNHNGHFALPEYCNGMGPMSASAHMMPNGNWCREMNEDDMNQVADSYAAAALMAKRGGFDQVLLHYGHGWLFAGFMSPLINQRTDKYGGSIENRARFPRMTIERIRKKVGDSIHIELRISGDEIVPDGLKIPEVTEFIKIYEDLIDLVHISSGTRWVAHTRADMHPSQFIAHAHTAPLAKYVKEHGVKIPVGCVGNVSDPVLGEKLLAEGFVDYLVMARSTIADTNWANKVRNGKEDDIRPCIRCNHCVDAHQRVAIATDVLQDWTSNENPVCSVNPLYGTGAYKKHIPLNNEKRRVVIIGGGPAGLNAAIFTHDNGHNVTLYEKSSRLGGIVNYADHVPFKHNLADYRTYLINQVNKRKITVKLGVEATPEIIAEDRPDVVIVAVGADPLIPPIPGVEKAIQALDVMGHEEDVGKKVVIIGGGMVGCELSIHLNHLGRTCTVVETIQHLCATAQLSERLHIIRFMDEAGVVSHTLMKCIEITDSGAKCVDQYGKEHFFKADTIILCTGMKPRTDVRNSFTGSAFDVINIGDCRKVGVIRDAVHSAFDSSVVL